MTEGIEHITLWFRVQRIVNELLAGAVAILVVAALQNQTLE